MAKQEKNTAYPPNVVPIHRIDDYGHWGLFPATIRGGGKTRPRFREIGRRRGNCGFTRGVPAGMIDFIYRAVLRLGLKDRRFVFTRGFVIQNGRRMKHAVATRELAWGMGTVFVIPKNLSYHEKIRLSADGDEHVFRVMEIMVLCGLLKIFCPDRPLSWYSEMSPTILAYGWQRLSAPEKENISGRWRVIQ